MSWPNGRRGRPHLSSPIVPTADLPKVRQGEELKDGSSQLTYQLSVLFDSPPLGGRDGGRGNKEFLYVTHQDLQRNRDLARRGPDTGRSSGSCCVCRQARTHHLEIGRNRQAGDQIPRRRTIVFGLSKYAGSESFSRRAVRVYKPRSGALLSKPQARPAGRGHRGT